MLHNHETCIEQLNSCTQINLQNVTSNFTIFSALKGGHDTRNNHGNDRSHIGGRNYLSPTWLVE